jgi:hypothetical protein
MPVRLRLLWPNVIQVNNRNGRLNITICVCRIQSDRAQLIGSAGNHLTGCGANRLRGQ